MRNAVSAGIGARSSSTLPSLKGGKRERRADRGRDDVLLFVPEQSPTRRRADSGP